MRLVGLEQLFDFGAQCFVLAALPVEVRGALIDSQLARASEEFLDAGVLFGVHREASGWGAWTGTKPSGV